MDGTWVAALPLVDILVVPIIVFGFAVIAGVGVLRLAWPLLQMREHRRRMITMLALVTVLVVCSVFGQFILDGFARWCAPRPTALVSRSS